LNSFSVKNKKTKPARRDYDNATTPPLHSQHQKLAQKLAQDHNSARHDAQSEPISDAGGTVCRNCASRRVGTVSGTFQARPHCAGWRVMPAKTHYWFFE